MLQIHFYGTGIYIKKGWGEGQHATEGEEVPPVIYQQNPLRFTIRRIRLKIGEGEGGI